MYATNAAAAYATVSSSILGPRDIEQRIFRQTNGRLMAFRDDPNAPFTNLAEAVYVNTKLWTMLAVDAFSDDNTMPETLRAQIASLSLYAQKTGRAVLRKEAPVDELIDLNNTIIAGLNGDAGTAPTPHGVQ